MSAFHALDKLDLLDLDISAVGRVLVDVEVFEVCFPVGSCVVVDCADFEVCGAGLCGSL